MAIESFLNLEDIDLDNKRVFLRLDLNVPLKNGQVIDKTRIEAALPTLQYLIDKKAKVIVASHLGRPKTLEDRRSLSLEPVARCLNESGFEVLLMETPDSEAPYELCKSLTGSQIILLENIRFAEGETQNSTDLAGKWAKYTDVYVNDAFGASHRAHASIDALPKLIQQRCYGFLIDKELKALQKIKDHPAQPFALLTGGSKVSDKLPLLESLAERVDTVLIGGAMAYTFLKAQGREVGRSLVENDKLQVAKKFLDQMNRAGKEVFLPIDHRIVMDIESDQWSETSDASVPAESIAVDIGSKTTELYTKILQGAGTIFWNGPMGIYEKPPFHEGSFAMAQALSDSKAFTVIGGGDSAAAAVDSGCAQNMNHISTGGGASLEFIQGRKLPGIDVLKVRRPE